ncbi:MAG: AbgT family transporter [Phycisphaerales bacterium]|nr:MAG: AbgT family transporter [Phycisphaerales bacterium]
MEPLSRKERKALAGAGLAAVAMSLLIAYFAGPQFTQEADLPAGTTISEARSWSAEELRAQIAEVDRMQQEEGPANVPTVRLFPPEKEGWRGTVNVLAERVPGYGVLRNPLTNDVLSSPLLRGMVTLIFIFFLVPGFVYGRLAGTMKNDRDVIDAMAGAMSSLGLYIVLVFFAAQFVSFFNWTNLGSITAVVGADTLQAMNLTGPLVFIPFILMCCFVNLMLGSASAQWAVTAPIFVPMLMLVGYSPEVIQAAYRIGDSTTNIITPMMSYFGLILAFVVRYDKRAGIGTMISMMLPYSVCFLLGWIVLFYAWVFWFGMPVGPGAPTYYTPGSP